MNKFNTLARSIAVILGTEGSPNLYLAVSPLYLNWKEIMTLKRITGYVQVIAWDAIQGINDIKTAAEADALAFVKQEAKRNNLIEALRKKQEAIEANINKGVQRLTKRKSLVKKLREKRKATRAKIKARAKAEDDAKAKTEARAKVEAEAKAKTEAKAKAKADAKARAKAKAEADAKAKAEADAKTKSCIMSRLQITPDKEVQAIDAAFSEIEKEKKPQQTQVTSNDVCGLSLDTQKAWLGTRLSKTQYTNTGATA